MDRIKEALIKSVRGELVETRTIRSLSISGSCRSPFDRLRAKGRLVQRLLNRITKILKTRF